MLNAHDAKKAGYICGDCTDAAGGEWPSGHVATWSEGTCGLCKKQTMRAAWDDWNWPGHDLDDEATITREF